MYDSSSTSKSEGDTLLSSTWNQKAFASPERSEGERSLGSKGWSDEEGVSAGVRGSHNDGLDGAVARLWQVGKTLVVGGPAGA